MIFKASPTALSVSAGVFAFRGFEPDSQGLEAAFEGRIALRPRQHLLTQRDPLVRVAAVGNRQRQWTCGAEH
jgi:hypothetical protein